MRSLISPARALARRLALVGALSMLVAAFSALAFVVLVLPMVPR